MAAKNFTTELHSDTYSYIQRSSMPGKTVLITGASRGIGQAVAISYAQAGASQIALAARTDLSAVQAEVHNAAIKAGHRPPKVLALSLDITSLTSVEASLKEIESNFGTLDVLINNAGYMEKSLSITESDPDDVWRSFEINNKGTYLMTKTFLPLLISSKGLGTIINLSSVSALLPMPGMSAYSTTKFALLRFTEMINMEYASQGIVAIAVHPGGVLTELAMVLPEALHGCKFVIHSLWNYEILYV